MRKAISLIAGAAMIFSLAACAEKPVPQPVATRTAEIAISDQQYQDIAAQTVALLNAADQTHAIDELKARAQDPFLEQRAAQYKLKGLQESFELPPVVIDVKAQPVESGAGFPRSMLSYSAPVEGQNQRTLTAWQQLDARSNYKLWGQVTLFPDSGLPTLASVLNDDSAVPSKNPQAYLADPAQLIAAYAEYVNTQQLGQVPFESGDRVATNLKGQLDQLVEDLGDFAEISLKARDSERPIVGVSTQDGGLVVLGNLLYDVTYTSKNADRPIVLKNSPIALLYSEDAEKADLEIGSETPLTAHYSMTLAFYIPPKAAKADSAQKDTSKDGDNKEAAEKSGDKEADAQPEAPMVRLIGASTNILIGASV